MDVTPLRLAAKSTFYSVFFVLVYASVCWAMQPAWSQTLFDTLEFPVSRTQSLPRWESLLSRYAKQQATLKACAENKEACPTEAMRNWHDMLQANKTRTDKLQVLASVNRFINRWPYKTDWQAWGVSDYWATPLEFTDRSGDCEDYTIFKYITLQHLGFAVEDLRLVVVRDTIRNIPHAVLAVYLPDDIMILDSLFNRPLSHTQVIQYTPYYSVNEKTRWAHLKKPD